MQPAQFNMNAWMNKLQTYVQQATFMLFHQLMALLLWQQARPKHVLALLI